MRKNPHFQGKISQGREEAMENERRRGGNGQGKIKATRAAGSGGLVLLLPPVCQPEAGVAQLGVCGERVARCCSARL